MAVHVDPLTIHADDRGFVFEPMETSQFSVQRNAHIVVTLPGAIRGNHYHRKGTETIAVMGPALVRIRDANSLKDFNIPPDQALRFRIPPGVSHAIQNTGREPQILVAFNTHHHDRQEPDVVPDVLIAPTG